jgi:6-phosphogluconolactonase
MANHHLFSKVPIPTSHIYRIPIEFGYAEDVAKEYENRLRNFFKISEHQFPSFDLCYLGLGSDGHTASLMPNSQVVNDYTKKARGNTDSYALVVALQFYSQGIYERITLTPAAINHAKTILFMVAGENKAEAVFQVLSGPYNPEQYPAQLIHGIDHKPIWYLDQAAASQLIEKGIVNIL